MQQWRDSIYHVDIFHPLYRLTVFLAIASTSSTRPLARTVVAILIYIYSICHVSNFYNPTSPRCILQYFYINDISTRDISPLMRRFLPRGYKQSKSRRQPRDQSPSRLRRWITKITDVPQNPTSNSVASLDLHKFIVVPFLPW